MKKKIIIEFKVENVNTLFIIMFKYRKTPI